MAQKDEDTAVIDACIGTSTERRQQVAYYAHALCERVSQRYNLLAARGIVNAEGQIPAFIGSEERIAYAAACQHLTKCFGVTEP